MTTLTLGGFTGRLRAITRPSSATGRRFRGKKFTVDALLQKRQVVDFLAARLVEEVAAVRRQWAGITSEIAAFEKDRLASIVLRTTLMQQSVARAIAGIEMRSLFGLNACDADIQTAVSLIGKLRLEVRVSAARAAAASAGHAP